MQAAGEQFPPHQEFLAYILGVRRQAVSIFAGSLQNAGLITYRRGVVAVVDRPGVEDASCECYGVMRACHTRPFG